jgi:hypothetical protein
LDIKSIKRTFSPMWRKLPKSTQRKVSAQLPADFHRSGYFHVMADFKVARSDVNRPRVNMLLPSVNKDHVTGGPATLVNFMLETKRRLPGMDLRFLPIMVPFDPGKHQMPASLGEFHIVTGNAAGRDDQGSFTVVADAGQKAHPISLRQNDIFVASMWPTFFPGRALLDRQEEFFRQKHKLLYIVQDYEPLALYSWSDFYLLALQTYQDPENTIPLIATESLYRYMEKAGHSFPVTYHFDPKANATPVNPEDFVEKQETILIYGRPDTPRNCFTLIFEALYKVTAEHPSIAERFRFVSVGEKHADYRLNHGAKLESLGFMDPADYKDLVLKSAIGVFFVVSPHTGYVALELANSGALVVSNSFETKNITELHPNIREPASMSPAGIADAIVTSVQEFWREPDSGPSRARSHYEHINRNPKENFPFLEDLFKDHLDG